MESRNITSKHLTIWKWLRTTSGEYSGKDNCSQAALLIFQNILTISSNIYSNGAMHLYIQSSTHDTVLR